MILKIEDWNWELILGLIGALAWIPWLFDKFTPAKLYGNVISQFANQGTFNNSPGVLHYLKLSLTCINKNYNIKEIRIQVKYTNDERWYNGEIFWARTSTWVMADNITRKQLTIPNTEFLGFTNILEVDKSRYYYLTFMTEKEQIQEFEIIRISFYDFKGKHEDIIFNATQINENNILWDDSIWN